MKIKWQGVPEDHDYPAALSYLSLIFAPEVAQGYVDKLKVAATTGFKAKDIFRASRLPLLGVSNGHVERDRQKMKADDPLSPLLLVRDPANGRVIIADGYHRLCAVYSCDEDAAVPCRIV